MDPMFSIMREKHFNELGAWERNICVSLSTGQHVYVNNACIKITNHPVRSWLHTPNFTELIRTGVGLSVQFLQAPPWIWHTGRTVRHGVQPALGVTNVACRVQNKSLAAASLCFRRGYATLKVNWKLLIQLQDITSILLYIYYLAYLVYKKRKEKKKSSAGNM